MAIIQDLPQKVMDKAIVALALELPESVHHGVSEIYQTYREQFTKMVDLIASSHGLIGLREWNHWMFRRDQLLHELGVK